jgi:hypothetical protein
LGGGGGGDGRIFFRNLQGLHPYSKFIKQKPNPIRHKEAKTKTKKKQKNRLQ